MVGLSGAAMLPPRDGGRWPDRKASFWWGAQYAARKTERCFPAEVTGDIWVREYVRAVHRESQARNLLRKIRGQSVRLSVHRDGTPAAGLIARRQSVDQPLSALSCVGRVHPQAN